MRKANTQFNARILVAEDNPVNLDIAGRILETLGCRVVTANNGAVAALLLTQEKFDLVFMDYEMPDLDGLEATKLARSVELLTSLVTTGAGKRTPIIALTSHVLDDVRQKCLAGGMDDLLAKPFNKQQMREVLHRWIGDLEIAGAAADGMAAAENAQAALPQTPGSDNPSIDRTVMNALLESQGAAGSAFLKRLFDRFAEMAPQHMAGLWEKYRAGQADEVWRTAHNLRSGASALGARQLAHRCGEIEKQAREHGLSGLEPKLALLEADLGAALESLKSLGRELGERAGAA